jgi:hypothetical protein
MWQVQVFLSRFLRSQKLNENLLHLEVYDFSGLHYTVYRDKSKQERFRASHNFPFLINHKIYVRALYYMFRLIP